MRSLMLLVVYVPIYMAADIPSSGLVKDRTRMRQENGDVIDAKASLQILDDGGMVARDTQRMMNPGSMGQQLLNNMQFLREENTEEEEELILELWTDLKKMIIDYTKLLRLLMKMSQDGSQKLMGQQMNMQFLRVENTKEEEELILELWSGLKKMIIDYTKLIRMLINMSKQQIAVPR